LESGNLTGKTGNAAKDLFIVVDRKRFFEEEICQAGEAVSICQSGRHILRVETAALTILSLFSMKGNLGDPDDRN